MAELCGPVVAVRQCGIMVELYGPVVAVAVRQCGNGGAVWCSGSSSHELWGVMVGLYLHVHTYTSDFDCLH